MATLLVEIGCEELPANACRAAAEQLPGLCEKHLGARPDRLYVGPRRLGIVLESLVERAADELRRGPGEGIAFDAEGNPTKAAEGFARGLGLTVDRLERRDGYVWGVVAGQSIRDSLPERVAELVRGIAFGKPMQWVAGGMRFSRPIRWLCVKLDADTIEVALEGISSGGSTWGHRFTHGAVEVPHASAYAETLRAVGVEPDEAERRRLIVAGLDELGPWQDPAGKLAEVVHLVESAVVLEGTFADRFLALPERVVVTAMQSHQRYFPLGGPRFGFVANGGDPDVVRAGNERVLEGRLEDATFTFERDVHVGIEGLAERLPSITFVAKVGSFADKTARLVRLVQALGGDADAREAARLAKADQAAELVREFPDLEGHIGAQYARLAGKSEAVCQAIEEQYLPDAAGGPLPESAAGRLVAAAEKLDNLTAAFALGQEPTGSRDPFGLRRAATGLCRLAIEGGLPISVADLVRQNLWTLTEQEAELSRGHVEIAPARVEGFVRERLTTVLNIPVEYVRAATDASTISDLGEVANLAQALHSAPASALEPLREVYTRAARILLKANETDLPEDLDRSVLSLPAEQDLLGARDRVLEAMASLNTADKPLTPAERIGEFGSLAAPLAQFFDDVLVMDPVRDVRLQRLLLLTRIRDDVSRWVGDLSQLPG